MGTTLVWALFVNLFAISSRLDIFRRGLDSSYIDHMMAWGSGMLPWLVMMPVLYLFAQRESVLSRPRFVQLGRTIIAFIVCFSFLFAYFILIYGPLTGSDSRQFLATTRLADWLWDGILFVTVYLAGRLAGVKLAVVTKDKKLKIAVRSSGKVELVRVSDIVAGSAQGNYITLICEGRDYLHRATLSEMLSELSAEGFLQTHRSHFIRPEQISTINSQDGHVRDVYLKNGRRIPVSKRYEKMVREVALQTV